MKSKPIHDLAPKDVVPTIVRSLELLAAQVRVMRTAECGAMVVQAVARSLELRDDSEAITPRLAAEYMRRAIARESLWLR